MFTIDHLDIERHGDGYICGNLTFRVLDEEFALLWTVNQQGDQIVMDMYPADRLNCPLWLVHYRSAELQEAIFSVIRDRVTY